MGKIFMRPIGGGYGSDDVTASKADVLKGKKTITTDSGDEIVEGTLELTGNVGAAQMLTGYTGYSNNPKSKISGSMANRGAVSQQLSINGTYTIPAGCHNGSGKVTQSIPTQGAKTVTPGTSNITAVSSGRYVTGNIVVKGDSNLKAENIKANVKIFGVTGNVS